MKKMTLLFAVLGLSALSTYGQDAKVGPVFVPPQSAEKPMGEKKTPLAPPMTNAVLGKPVSGGGQVLVAPPSTQKSTEEKKLPLTPPKMTNAVLGKPVIYGGYFTDFVRAEKKRALFDLRTPLDPEKDLENLFFYPGTQQVQGISLFSIKF